MVHIQIYGHIPFFFILGRGLFQCPRHMAHPFLFADCVICFHIVFVPHAIRSMHEVVLRVVAIAVRMVMAMCSIFCQIVFVSISCLVMS
jgi:hypothetical protein